MEALVLSLFAAGLLLCIRLGWSLVLAMLFGYVLFFAYGLFQGRRPRRLLRVSGQGVAASAGITLVFLLIGALTAVWRAAGTIPLIITWAAPLLSPSAAVLLSFLLCSLVSFLTGTSFGTAATMGSICMSVGSLMGVSPALLGGAILSGSFFGDRSSPMSTSALLVASVTGTDLYDNLKGMLRTALVPFLVTCGVYCLSGFAADGTGAAPELAGLFSAAFRLHWAAALPAALVLLLSLLRVPVRWSMLASIALGSLLCLILQGTSLPGLLSLLFFGYHCPDAALAPMLDGGGILSMVEVTAMVLISSSYSGLFRETGLLRRFQGILARLARHVTPFGSTALASLFTAMIACNQTLAILLTHQLCLDLLPDLRALALDLENTVVVIAPLIPWSIAAAVPLTVVGAPSRAILWAAYLYLVPLWNLLAALRRRGKGQSASAVSKS